MSLGARSAAQLPQQNLEVQGRAKSRVPGPVVKVLVMPGRDGSPCVSLGGPCAAVKSWRCQAGTGSPVCWACVCEVLEAPGRECPPYVSHARWSGQSCRDYRHVFPWFITWRSRVLGRLAGSNACPAPHPSVTRVRIPAPQHPSASATATPNPGFRPPRFSHTGNQIRPCQRHSTDRDPHRRSVPDKTELSVRLAPARRRERATHRFSFPIRWHRSPEPGTLPPAIDYLRPSAPRPPVV
jgi:hypothetical protein